MEAGLQAIDGGSKASGLPQDFWRGLTASPGLRYSTAMQEASPPPLNPVLVTSDELAHPAVPVPPFALPPRGRGWIRLAMALQALLFVLFTVLSLRTTAPTFDEVAHLPAGYAQLEEGSARLNTEHPPLVKLLAASMVRPLLPPMQDLGADVKSLNEWAFGRRLLFETGQNPQQLFFLARLPMIALGALLLLLMTRWTEQLAGPVPALMVLTISTSAPLLLAHTRLVTTDVPVACFGFMSAYLAWRWWQRPRWGLAMLLGIALGATLASKFSGIVLVLGIGMAFSWRLLRDPNPPMRAAATQLPLALLMAVGCVMLSYGPPFSPLSWWEGVRTVGFNHTQGYAFYLLGQYSPEGFSLYFWMAWLLKSSPLELLWVLSGAVAAVLLSLGRKAQALTPDPDINQTVKPQPTNLSGEGENPRTETVEGVAQYNFSHSLLQLKILISLPFLIFPGISYALFIQLTAPPIGLRYVIPVLPFLYVLCAVPWGLLLERERSDAALRSNLPSDAESVAAAARQKAGNSAFLPLLALLGMFGAEGFILWRAWPDPISYFNGWMGCGGLNAHNCLDDSNLDWGQDLARIADAIEPIRDPDNEVRLLYFGTAFPGAYLTLWKPMQEDELLHPAPAIYVVSLHRLHRLNESLGRPNGMDWFERFKPIGSVGNTYLIYDFRTLVGSRDPAPARANARVDLARSVTH